MSIAYEYDMPTSKSRTGIWLDEADRENIAAIRRTFRLPSDAAAIRYALQRLATATLRRSS